jgi:hypothetical protein
MRFRNRETDLERELRAQRPQPRKEFVQMLTRPSAAPKVRRRLVPGLVVVASVTAVLAGSLGTAGALGAATHSVVKLYRSVGHIVEPARAPKLSASHNVPNKAKGDKGDAKGDKGDGTGNGNGGNAGGQPTGDPTGKNPFEHQYDHLEPVCFDKHIIIFVFRREALILLASDGHHFTPASTCRRR